MLFYFTFMILLLVFTNKYINMYTGHAHALKLGFLENVSWLKYLVSVTKQINIYRGTSI